MALSVACGGDPGTDADAGMDAAVDAPLTSMLVLGPPHELGETDGETSVTWWDVAVAGDSVIAVAELGGTLGTLVAQRLDAAGVSLGEPVTLPAGNLMAVDGRSTGEAVVSWQTFRSPALQHTLIAADGSLETIPGGALAESDGVLMTRLTTDGVQTWVVECEPSGVVPEFRCSVELRESRRDGTSVDPVEVVPQFSTRYSGRNEPGISVGLGTMEESQGAVLLLVDDPPSVRVQWLDAEGLASGDAFDLGIYSPTAMDEGLLNQPLALSVRSDGGALLTREERR